MKKAILIFILLLLIAGAVGYFGWVRIEPGTFGIAHSTVTGFIEGPIPSDRFNWYWQKLVPRSFTLYVIENRPVSFDLDIAQSLPGSDLLSEYGTFDLNVRVSVEYTIDPVSARVLIEQGLLEGFDSYLRQSLKDEVGGLVSSFLVSTLQDATEALDASTLLEGLRSRIDRTVSSAMARYDIEKAAWNIRFTKIPQIDAYMEAMNSYREYLAEAAAHQREELQRRRNRQIQLDDEALEIEKLRLYGELIEQHPLLLKYLYIQKLGEQTRVILLPEDKATGFPEFLESPTPGVMEKREAEPEEPQGAPQTKGSGESSPPQGGEVTGGDGAQDVSPAGASEKKWWEYLMFWKYFGSGDKR
jgi:hypothetical protein